MLVEIADLLEQQKANPFRFNAYRKAASTLLQLDTDIHEFIIDNGFDGLVSLPTIGKGIATAIWEIDATGRCPQLDRLRGTQDPADLFQNIPGVGPELAQRIHDQLHIDTLEALETAAYDGSLDEMEGIGPRRLAAIRAGLESSLRRKRWQEKPPLQQAPAIELILQLDGQYREKASRGELPTIMPRRFNLQRKAWLPILHTDKDGWHFTAIYSNTALAHELDKVKDWVIIYFYDNHHQEGRHTVVSESQGELKGQRVVRGRELECRRYYQLQPQ